MASPNDTPALVALDSGRAALIAHLDASDHWERRNMARPRADLRWSLAQHMVPDLHGLCPDVTLPTDESAPYVDESRACAEAVHMINSIALDIDPCTNDPAVVERFIAILDLAEPGSAIARIAGGQVETV
ncbi:hypothetical protein AB0F17_61980 [Nonomuraea sp. NPDC026600]|uniref:hypothetical protein n=1 Tax=Nonomuraea sp. NPDC026600 TaxID=3155363 RepID=UPI0033EC468D